ncbi:hypothetical protein OIN60_04205 [Paenibacillus sp. P96]|uniref:Uncharacterized protein n=1 Tax=Paenibacillus zeirhizosphaerae TaxID=2987519 RepID=A0ABT9FMN3_9BACL|nr:hypothetical protein [Paenibacillus sp. P96]MDP4095989.1 hypothetical protein [Paenibacillus sp. P96]
MEDSSLSFFEDYRISLPFMNLQVMIMLKNGLRTTFRSGSLACGRMMRHGWAEEQQSGEKLCKSLVTNLKNSAWLQEWAFSSGLCRILASVLYLGVAYLI